MLPTAGHRCDISSKEAVLPGQNDAEMGPANSLHALTYYSEYNERFDLILNIFVIGQQTFSTKRQNVPVCSNLVSADMDTDFNANETT